MRRTASLALVSDYLFLVTMVETAIVFNYLKGISSDNVNFEVSKLLILFTISSYVTISDFVIHLFFNAKNAKMSA